MNILTQMKIDKIICCIVSITVTCVTGVLAAEGGEASTAGSDEARQVFKEVLEIYDPHSTSVLNWEARELHVSIRTDYQIVQDWIEKNARANNVKLHDATLTSLRSDGRNILLSHSTKFPDTEMDEFKRMIYRDFTLVDYNLPNAEIEVRHSEFHDSLAESLDEFFQPLLYAINPVYLLREHGDKEDWSVEWSNGGEVHLRCEDDEGEIQVNFLVSPGGGVKLLGWQQKTNEIEETWNYSYAQGSGDVGFSLLDGVNAQVPSGCVRNKIQVGSDEEISRVEYTFDVEVDENELSEDVYEIHLPFVSVTDDRVTPTQQYHAIDWIPTKETVEMMKSSEHFRAAYENAARKIAMEGDGNEG